LVNGLKECKREKQLTSYRSEGGLGQQASKGAKDNSDSRAAEVRVGLISGVEIV
jgi:hypothetical protein